jgi:spermidine synthase
MSMEVVWVRAYMAILARKFVLAFILGVYLFATAVGSYLYRRHLQVGAVWKTDVVLTGLFAVSFLPLVLGDPRIVFFLEGSVLNGMSMPMVVLGIFPLCALTGYLTPQLIDVYSRGRPEQGGKAYAVNIIGCIIGPVLASYVLLPYLGIKWSLVLLSVPFMLLHLFYHLRQGLRTRWHGVMSAVAAALLLISVFLSNSYEEHFGGADRGRVVRRDYAATVLSFGQGLQKELIVNGQGITGLTPITKYMAHLPLSFFEGTPHSALVVCFGMGTTYRSLLSWGIDVTAVELVPSVRDAFGYYFDDADAMLRNPRGRIIIDDGRRFLKRTDMKFDVITIDPPPPVEAAGVSLLMSGEFYDSMKEHLNAGGIVQQWFPFGEDMILYATTRAIVNSFKHVKVYRSIEGHGYHFIASDSDLKLPAVAELASRMPAGAQRDMLEWSDGKDVRAALSTVLKQEVPLGSLLTNDAAAVISDDKPYNEYFMLRRLRASFNNTYRTVQ